MREEKTISYSINTVFVGVSRRAEAVDRQTLVQTFVDIGPLFAVLSSNDHQIVYGRRGTGKTHALLYLSEQAKTKGVVPIYVDLRYIGSSGGLYADTSAGVPQRATRLLMDALGSVHEALLEYAVNSGVDLATVGPALDELASSVTELEVVGEVQRETRELEGSEDQKSSNSKIELRPQPSAELSARTASKRTSESETRFAEVGPARYSKVAQSLCFSNSAVVALGTRQKPQSFWDAKLCATC